EDAGPTRLEQERLPAELLPGVAILWAARQLRTRQNEAILVDGDLAGEPRGARFGSDQHDHGTRRKRPAFLRPHLLHDDVLHMPVTADLADLAAEQRPDLAPARDAVAQLARPRALAAASAHPEIHVPPLLGERARCLAGRVRSPAPPRRIARTELFSRRVDRVADAET